MKCPECGLWNRASQPHCTRCGTPLNIDEASRIGWKESLRDGSISASYLRADEFGQTDETPEARDALAGEMQDLKQRKNRGARLQQQLRRNSPESSPRVQIRDKTEQNPSSIQQTIVLEQITESGLRSRRESELRSRVRFLDENGAFIESRVYDPLIPESFRTGDEPHTGYTSRMKRYQPGKRISFSRILIVLLIIALIGGGGWLALRHFLEPRKVTAENPPGVVISAGMLDDVIAHMIMIPGEEGSTIYIPELHASYVVTNGFASVEVPDHIWYDNLEGSLDETMDVTLNPFLKTSAGRQAPMDPIHYTISIPLSPVTLESPSSTRTTVSTTMATIKINVRPGSRVTVKGKDCSDTVSSDTGDMTYNANISPIGDNVFDIVVRSPYCRENTLTVVFYRAKQEVPLDLAVGTYGTTDRKIMKVNATTQPGAYVEVKTPHSDLNITELNSTGKFSFNAVFDHIGDNTITIVASYQDKTPSQVDHTVYYLPPPDEYTVKAWPLTPEGYAELLSNITVRAKNCQVYVVKGIVQYFVSEKPQMAVINTSDDGKSQPVLVENYTKTKWEIGKYYRLYADAFSTYNGMPYLNARYTYKN